MQYPDMLLWPILLKETQNKQNNYIKLYIKEGLFIYKANSEHKTSRRSWRQGEK